MGQVNVYKNQNVQFPMVYYSGSNQPPPMPIYPEVLTPDTGLKEFSKTKDSIQNAQFPMVYYPESNQQSPIPFMPMPIYPEVPTPETGLIELSKAEDSKHKELKRNKRLSEPKLEPWTWSWFFYHLSRYRPMK